MTSVTAPRRHRCPSPAPCLRCLRVRGLQQALTRCLTVPGSARVSLTAGAERGLTAVETSRRNLPPATAWWRSPRHPAASDSVRLPEALHPRKAKTFPVYKRNLGFLGPRGPVWRGRRAKLQDEFLEEDCRLHQHLSAAVRDDVRARVRLPGGGADALFPNVGLHVG